MAAAIQLENKYGRLTVLREIDKLNSHRRVEVQCDCGKVFNVYLTSLIKKNKPQKMCKSCSIAEINKTAKLKHGLCTHPLYHVWAIMKERCNNKNDKSYKRYGGRGITVCDEWKNDFKSFCDWAMNNGYKKGLQLDRINNLFGYSPDNCRFVSAKDNSNNRSNTLFVEGKPAALWFEDVTKDPTVTYKMFYNRYFVAGWDLNLALLTPKSLKK